MKIVYKNESGGVSIITPTPEALKHVTINEIALKDVPAGKPYKIIDASEIPEDRSQRNAWTVDDAELTDGIGGESNEFN